MTPKKPDALSMQSNQAVSSGTGTQDGLLIASQAPEQAGQLAITTSNDAGIPTTGGQDDILCPWNLGNLSGPIPFRAAIEFIDQNGIGGWCFDTRDTAKPVRLKLFFCGAVISEFEATEPRTDIQDIIGNPCCPGFSLQWASCRVPGVGLEMVKRSVQTSPNAPAAVEIRTAVGDIVFQRLPNTAVHVTNAELWALLVSRTAQKSISRPRISPLVEREQMLARYASTTALKRSSEQEAEEVKVVAFYLPQYHPTPENDVWWGPGFTEWTNVSSAKPLFPGHEQPRLPADLGFYDLRLPEVREKQATLAREYGVQGFCYYYYWFSGRRILERPLEDMLRSGTPDFPFCVCWANESWSRRWDGSEKELLIGQEHDFETDVTLIDDLIPLFEDPRYIRVGGRPLLIIYRVGLLPDAARLFDRWREICVQRGLEPPHICMAETFGLHSPHQYGCDSAVEFPPHKTVSPVINSDVEGLPEDYTGNIYDYRMVVQNDLHAEQPLYTRFRSVMASWDNTARRGKAGNVFLNATPELYEIWLQGVIEQTRKIRAPGERLVFVNAWNEWAEGTHLEPSRLHGRAYLEATRRALTDTSDWRRILERAELEGEISSTSLPTFIASLRKRLEAYEKSAKYLSDRLASKEILWGQSLPTKVKPYVMSARPVVPCAKVRIDRLGPFPGTKHVVHRRETGMSVVGWSASPGFYLTQDTLTYLTLTSIERPDEVWYVPVYYRKQRDDVVQHTGLPNHEAQWAGFELNLRVEAMPRGSYWIGFDYPAENAVYRGYANIELTLE